MLEYGKSPLISREIKLYTEQGYKYRKKTILKKNQIKVYLAEQISYFGSEKQGTWST